MAAIRPLFAHVSGTFGEDFMGQLEHARQALPSTGPVQADEVLKEIRKAVNWLLATQKINNLSAKPKDVAEHLEIVERRAKKYRVTRDQAWKAKLLNALHMPDLAQDGADIAKLIAIEYLAASAIAHRFVHPLPKGDLHELALATLAALNIEHSGTLEWLEYWARKQRELIIENQNDTAKRLSELEGTEIIEGQLFMIKPDPLKGRNARPLGDCLDDFIGQLCLIYRWAGGSTYVPRDGRAATPFQRFLDALISDCPQLAKHGSLQSRARKVLNEERSGKRRLGFDSA